MIKGDKMSNRSNSFKTSFKFFKNFIFTKLIFKKFILIAISLNTLSLQASYNRPNYNNYSLENITSNLADLKINGTDSKNNGSNNQDRSNNKADYNGSNNQDRTSNKTNYTDFYQKNIITSQTKEIDGKDCSCENCQTADYDRDYDLAFLLNYDSDKDSSSLSNAYASSESEHADVGLTDFNFDNSSFKSEKIEEYTYSSNSPESILSQLIGDIHNQDTEDHEYPKSDSDLSDNNISKTRRNSKNYSDKQPEINNYNNSLLSKILNNEFGEALMQKAKEIYYSDYTEALSHKELALSDELCKDLNLLQTSQNCAPTTKALFETEISIAINRSYRNLINVYEPNGLVKIIR